MPSAKTQMKPLRAPGVPRERQLLNCLCKGMKNFCNFVSSWLTILADGISALPLIDRLYGSHQKLCVILLRPVALRPLERSAIKATAPHNGSRACLFHLHLLGLHPVILAHQVSQEKHQDPQVALEAAMPLPLFLYYQCQQEGHRLNEVLD